MLGAGLRVCFAWLAKSLTLLLKGHFIELTIVFDDVYGLALPVDEGGDLFSALIPAHLGALVLECLDEDDCLCLGHGKPIGKCLVIEGLDPFLVDC